MIVDEELTTVSSVGVKTIAWNELQISAWETASHADRLPSLPATADLGVTGDDPVMIFFSSGTTGPQKAVMLSHRNIHAQFVISWLVTDTLLRNQFFLSSTWVINIKVFIKSDSG